MRRMMSGLGLAAFAVAGASLAQDASAPDGEAVQRTLEERAVRIPASNLAAALKAADDGRTNRARVLPSRPDWQAVRDDLQRTQAEDAERETAPQEDTQRAPTRGLRAPPPPPGLRAFAAARLPNVDQAESDRVRIPVLAPAHPDVRNKVRLYGLEHSYTAAAEIDADAHLSISGTCSKVIGGAPATRELRKRIAARPRLLSGLRADYHISRNDYGVDLSFSKFSCGYVMTIECTDADNDERCSGDDYVTRLAHSMLLVNPERAESE